MLKPPRLSACALALALALLGASCGSDETVTETDGTDAMGEMDGMAMNMGDASATRADEIEGAELASGEFTLLDTRPEGFDDMTGTAWIARHAGGTTVTLDVQGLIPNADYISHVHADACANNGGDHYQFDVGGSDMPPNEIHLAFTSDADGNGFMTAENDQIASLDAVAFVVHPADLIDNKLACVDFVELEQGADVMDSDSMDSTEMDEDS